METDALVGKVELSTEFIDIDESGLVVGIFGWTLVMLILITLCAALFLSWYHEWWMGLFALLAVYDVRPVARVLSCYVVRSRVRRYNAFVREHGSWLIQTTSKGPLERLEGVSSSEWCRRSLQRIMIVDANEHVRQLRSLRDLLKDVVDAYCNDKLSFQQLYLGGAEDTRVMWQHLSGVPALKGELDQWMKKGVEFLDDVLP